MNEISCHKMLKNDSKINLLYRETLLYNFINDAPVS